MTLREHVVRESLWLVALTSLCTGVYTSLDSSRQAIASIEVGAMIGAFIAYPALGIVRVLLWALRTTPDARISDEQRG